MISRPGPAWRGGLFLTCAVLAGQGIAQVRSGAFDSVAGLVGKGHEAAVDFLGNPGAEAESRQRFANFHASNVGNGMVRVAKSVHRLVIEDVTVDGAYRVLENFNRERTADLRGLRLERIRASNVARGLARIGSNSSGGTIRDVDVTFRPEPATPPHLPVGIGFFDSAHDFLVERAKVRGAQMVRVQGKYTNGDGFSTERGNSRIRFVGCEAWDNSDGGFDLKGSEGWLDQTVAGRNRRNYRFWSSVKAGQISSIDADNSHIWISAKAGTPVIRIGKLIVRSSTTAPIFRVEGGTANIVVRSYDIQVPAGAKLLLGSATIDWGPQGEPRSHRS